MQTVLFRQSENPDPYGFYRNMLERTPIYFDKDAGIWAVYGYDNCLAILNYVDAHIPDPNVGLVDQFSPIAQQIAENLVRLSNPPQHHTIRPLVEQLFRRMEIPDTAEIMANTIRPFAGKTFDWVEVVSKRLPVLAVLAGFGIEGKDADHLAKNVATLTKMMQPNKSSSDIDDINSACEAVYPPIERWFTTSQRFIDLVSNRDDASSKSGENLGILVANFVGLLIQSFDAGRGLLSNSIIQYIANQPVKATMKQLVVETLRFDPPVQNTRRVLAADIELNGTTLRKGDQVLVVLAAANRDQAIFEHANQFNPLRSNNEQHLTFGGGIHDCLARHFMTDFVAKVLTFLDKHFNEIECVTNTIEYEALVNARLPKILRVRLGR